MGKVIPIVGIIIILGLFAYLVDQNDRFEETIKNDVASAKRIVADFGNSGEEIAFYLDPQPPITEFVYEEKEVVTQERFYNNETKKVEYRNVTTTEIEKIPVSEITINSYDRQTADTKVCKKGHQCEITGDITLIDPNTGEEIQPPYGFYIEISCEISKDPVILCSNFKTRSENILTHADKTFDYTFTTNSNDPIGLYLAKVSVASKFTTVDPVTLEESLVRRDANLRVEIVE